MITTLLLVLLSIVTTFTVTFLFMCYALASILDEQMKEKNTEIEILKYRINTLQEEKDIN